MKRMNKAYTKPVRQLSTSRIATAVGVHPNTVRMYEAWGFLPPVSRSPAGYRRFSEFHLDQMRLARLALHGTFPGRGIRRSAADVVRQSASGDLGGALEAAYQHLARVQAERAQSEAAVRLLQRWADGLAPDASGPPLHSGAAARRLGVTVDMLRNWERNNLLEVPRNPANGYRLYGGPELSRLRIIRMLSRAGYSTMAILRMLLVFDRGQGAGLRQALDTPRPDEDAFTAADRWLSTLAEEEARAEKIIALLEEMIHKQA